MPQLLKSKILFLIATTILSANVYSQAIKKTDLDPKELKLFNDAKSAAQKGDTKKSISLYKDLLEKRPNFTEGLLRLASNYYEQRNNSDSEKLFSKAIEIDPDYDPEMYYSLANVQQEMKKYLPAAANYSKYLDIGKGKPEKLKKAKANRDNMVFIENALKHPVPFKPENLGPNVNTESSEYGPSISLDGSTLIFTRRQGQEDFYLSVRDSLGFGKSNPIFGLNTIQDEGAYSLSADGKLMVFTACERKDAFGSCDLYSSIYRDNAWSIPTNMGHVVNSAAWDSEPSLSADGRTLYFSSTRLGTLGGSDLWMTYKDDKNAWVKPINLGPTVNTVDKDETPFLHPDGQTLYFRSNGRPGMGDFDIYYSRKDTNDQWTIPVNIGYPINTEGIEGAFTVSLDGKLAIFTSEMDYKKGTKRNNLDLNMFELYEGARPKPTTFVKGYISDANTNIPLQANVLIKDVHTGKIVFQTQTGTDGYFISAITVGNNYACIVTQKDYVYQSQNFDLSDVKVLHKPYVLNIALQPIPKVATTENNSPVIMRNIFFRSGSAELLPSSDTEIAQLASLMQQNPTIKIKVTGHTDNVGKDEDNLSLSQLRAKSVADALIRIGILADRIASEGKGESSPIDTNDTEIGRQNNRRTEFVIVN